MTTFLIAYALGGAFTWWLANDGTEGRGFLVMIALVWPLFLVGTVVAGTLGWLSDDEDEPIER